MAIMPGGTIKYSNDFFPYGMAKELWAASVGRFTKNILSVFYVWLSQNVDSKIFYLLSIAKRIRKMFIVPVINRQRETCSNR